MNAQLSVLFRAAAGEEAQAAEREFPLSDRLMSEYARAAGRRRLAWGAVVAVGCAVAVGAVAWGATQFWPGDEVEAVTTPSVTWSESASPTPTPTEASPSPSPSASPTPTPSAPDPTTAPPAVPDEPPAVAVPGAVTGVSAGPGGGSGEIVVNWDVVHGATGYRVYRATSADGEFSRAASVNAATGATSVEYGGSYEYIQIWQSSPGTFQYVEAVDGSPGYFKVAAFNDGGSGPKSAVVCGSPPPLAEGC